MASKYHCVLSCVNNIDIGVYGSLAAMSVAAKILFRLARYFSVMSNLIREQRLDKNGVLNTKLVRAGSKEKSARKTIPSPFGLPEKKTVMSDHQRSYLESLDKQRSHTVSSDDWNDTADSELRSLCSGMKSSKKLKCSDAEIMDVLKVVSEENVLPLLSAGVRSGKQAKKLLRANGLERLLTDNEPQVKNLVRWAMHPRNAVMPKRTPRTKDLYRTGGGYGKLSLNFTSSLSAPASF